MQSAWIDRDADAALARYADLGRDVALRVYTTRLLGQDPRLVLHGGGNTSVKTQLGRSQRRDRRRAVRQGLRLGYGLDRARGPAGGAARAPDKAPRPRKTVRRGDGAAAARQSDRSDGAEPVGRGAAACVHSAQIRRPHPFDGGARAHRPARWRSLVPRSLRQAGRLCPLHHAGFWPRQGRGAGVRRGSVGRRPGPGQAWHLQFWRRRTGGL